jgi:hypothetical protein
MRSGFITHQGVQILYCRYNRIDMAALGAEIAEVEGVLRKAPENSVRVLVDMTGTVISPSTLSILTKTSLEMKKHIRSTAVLGVEGVRVQLLDMLVKASGLPVKSFKTEEEAKTWLAST